MSIFVRPGFRVLGLAAVAVAFCFQATADEGFVDLLSGDLAEKWRGYQREGVPEAWRLADGMLSLDGSGGDLITREKYRDFDLRFEWKIAAGGNSGVMYLVSEDGAAAYFSGPEYQVLDSDAHPTAGDRQKPGALYDLYPYKPDATKPAGEWNEARIVIRDGAVSHWLNGVEVVSAEISSADWNDRVAASKFSTWERFGKNIEGHIALQDHDSRVWYRNVRVKRITPAAPTASASRRVLFVTQSAGFRHSTVTRKATDLSHCERGLQRLGVESGEFRVDCTQDVETDFTPELLANYDVVAFFTTGALPIPVERREWFLNTWLAEQGHGFFGFHAAADTYHDYEPFWDMIGGTFDGHPWTADTEVVLNVHDGDHPISRPWGPAGKRLAITDEIYQFKNWQPEKVRVLMSLDMQQTQRKRPWHVPVLWVKEYGAGRVAHMSLGHREDVWDNPTYQESIIGGMRWLMGSEQGDATPNPELSAEQQEIAEAAFEASGQTLPERERRRLALTRAAP